MGERWETIAGLFDDALTRPPGKRRMWLEEVCDDEAIRESVEHLLKAHERSTGVLDDPRSEFFGPASTAPSLTNARLGPYRLLRVIGKGGMGTVYLAERDDDQFEQRVAVKVLRHEVGETAARRFVAERQILATLDHPNIATLHDGGITEDGRPYFVMEYVEGTTLVEFCDEQTLSIEERIRLFVPVVRAVHDAHQNLVVHRDLKPSNILVVPNGPGQDGAATVKLLDFGIAKVLDPTGSDGAQPPVTRTGHMPMTPAYASPEQIQGGALTTASDVYQLGLILYELLVGRRPYLVEDRTPSEIEQVICEETVTPPSTAVTAARTDDDPPDGASPSVAATQRKSRPEELKRTLRGDLDAIVLMALRKEPDRRYSSAEELADDLERYVTGRPVVAHPDTWRYRVRSFVRRHRGTVVATVLVFLSMVVGLIGTAWQAHRASEQATVAKRERDKAEQVTSFLMDLFEANEPGQTLGDTVTAREVLQRGVERAHRLEGQPVVQAQMFDVIGQVYRSMGRYGRADSLLTLGLSRRRALHASPHPDIAVSLQHLGSLKEDAGAYAVAESLLTAAQAQYAKLYDEPHPDAVATMHALGTLYYAQGTYDQAEPLLRGALDGRRKLLGPNHPKVVSSLNNLAVLLQRTGAYHEAESLYRTALATRRQLFGDAHPKVATSMQNLATVLEQTGDVEAAERLHRTALEMRRQLFDGPHPDLASSLHNLASLLHTSGDRSGAEGYYRKALRMRRDVLGDAHPHTGVTLNNLARLLEERGQPRAAKRAYRESLTIFRTAFGDRHPYVAHPLVGIARILLERGAFTDAESTARAALSIRRDGLPDGHWKIGVSKVVLGRCLTGLGQYEPAEGHLASGYETLLSTKGPNHETTQRSLRALVALYESWAKPKEASRFRRLAAAADSS